MVFIYPKARSYCRDRSWRWKFRAGKPGYGCLLDHLSRDYRSAHSFSLCQKYRKFRCRTDKTAFLRVQQETRPNPFLRESRLRRKGRAVFSCHQVHVAHQRGFCQGLRFKCPNATVEEMVRRKCGASCGRKRQEPVEREIKVQRGQRSNEKRVPQEVFNCRRQETKGSSQRREGCRGRKEKNAARQISGYPTKNDGWNAAWGRWCFCGTEPAVRRCSVRGFVPRKLFSLCSGRLDNWERNQCRERSPFGIASAQSRKDGTKSSEIDRGRIPWEDEDSDQIEEEEGEGVGGYKRFFFAQLAKPVSRSSSRRSSEIIRQQERIQIQESIAGRRSRAPDSEGCRQSQVSQEEIGEERKEKEKENQEGEEGDGSFGQLSFFELRRRLGLWVQPVEQQRGRGRRKVGSTSEKESQEETRISPGSSGAACLQTPGADQQGRCIWAEDFGRDHGDQAGKLFQHSGETPDWDGYGPMSGDEYPGQCHGCIETGPARPMRRPSSSQIHCPSSECLGRQLVSSKASRVNPSRRRLGSRRRAGVECSKTCKAGGQGKQPRLVWGLERPRKRQELQRQKFLAGQFMECFKRQRRERRKRQRKRKELVEFTTARDGSGSIQEERKRRKLTTALGAPALVCTDVAQAHTAFTRDSTELGFNDFKRSLEMCKTFLQLGSLLMWWMVVISSGKSSCTELKDWFDDWISSKVAEDRSFRPRAKGATFPIRRGDLHDTLETYHDASLAAALSRDFYTSHGVDAWAFLVVCSLNQLAGTVAYPVQGRWTLAEKQAVNSIRGAVVRRSSTDEPIATLCEKEWLAELASKQVGYNGEEISICHELNWDQAVPALPPKEHGGCIDCLDWISDRTREFLLNPSKLLKPHDEVDLPRLPGRIHIKEDDKLKLALELIDRQVCDWIPLDQVYEVGGRKILNGLFGVRKPSSLPDGRPILRFIMNLTGSNSTQYQLEGGCTSLPAITSWQSIILDEGESLSLFQSDMCSAFYLFRIPRVWQPHLAFNVVFDGGAIQREEGVQFALACSVIPMGWLNSVGLMQEISENLLLRSHLSHNFQIAKGKPLPSWFNDIISSARNCNRHWWHVYLDNFCAGERISSGTFAQRGKECHELAEEAWRVAGVASAEKKRVSASERNTELGAEIDGEAGTLGVSTQKLVKLGQATLWLLAQRVLNRKHVQILAGRWVFALQFRRPAMSFFNQTWIFVGGKQRLTGSLRRAVKREFLQTLMASPLFHCFLGATIDHRITASDASETGCAVGSSENLTQAGLDFLQASKTIETADNGQPSPILLLSLFNGIGGCFRCYDVAGILPAVRIAVECNESANRITSRRWPGTIIVKDVREVDRTLVRQWSAKFLQIAEIHLWAGFPCTDLSSAKYGRLNLSGPNSSLFFEIPRIKNLLLEEFGPCVIIRHLLENVASMDESAAREISSEIGSEPYLVDPCMAVPMRRPRFAWTSEDLNNVFNDISLQKGRYWTEVLAEAPLPETEQWIEPGFTWKGLDEGVRFPTAMKCIPREVPPPKPAGYNRCSQACLQRWREDSFRYPPYQYKEEFLIQSETSWRLLSATEKELLMGYGFGHTELAFSASKIKQNKQMYFDTRHSFLGDSFSIYSFVIFAVALSQRFTPRVSYKHLAARMGLSPGFRAHLRCLAPLGRCLNYGASALPRQFGSMGMQEFNRMLLRKTNHTGSDIRVVSGEYMSPKIFPRQSVAASWWDWKDEFNRRWHQKAHINSLELEACLLAIKHQISRFKAVDKRIFHLSDSYVCLSVISKGRTSSRILQRTLNKIAAHLLAHGLQLVVAHVESSENPTDRGSRL